MQEEYYFKHLLNFIQSFTYHGPTFEMFTRLIIDLVMIK